MTTKGITNNTTLITNNANLVQVGDSAFTGTIAANGGVYTPTIVGSNGLEYNTTTTTGIHNFKIYGTPKVQINNTDLTNSANFVQVGTSTFTGAITANDGITSSNLKCNTTTSTPYYMGGNNFSAYSIAISNPKIYNGIASGTGDGYGFSTFNNAINAWYATGFINTCDKNCNAYINHRTGDFVTNGAITALGGISLGDVNSDPLKMIRNTVSGNTSELALYAGDDGLLVIFFL
jgi:Phage T4 tail fibre